MIRQYELLEKVRSYDPGFDEDALNRAYIYALKAHGSQKRASGDPYFSHPLEVAGILTDYKLDSNTIITALLHDTVEDTSASIEDINKNFGPDVARLVDGVTKLTKIEIQSDQSNQAENFRKLVLAMSEDLRVLLVKLADRLHNMRTLHYIDNQEKSRRIALETMEIYAPLAERIGMQEMKAELEDLSFSILNPDARNSIKARLGFLREKGGGLVKNIISQLEKTLSDAGIKATILGREKSPYSIWRKMQHKDVGFEQLSDIMGFRVIVKSVEACYKALGAVHGAYSMVPDRFKDYISTPKPNAYQSIHTGVIGPERQRIEIQIRTQDMNDIAENGVAVHWQYKQGHGKTEGRQYRWLRGLLDILEHASGPEEFLEHTKLEMFADQVFCFSPKGDIIALPSGATPVDFAYAVHSEVGDHCVGAKVNGRMMPLRTRLANGDQVDILTSNAQTPSPTWERFVATGKARARIRRFVRLKEREQYIELGRSILQRIFQVEDYVYADKALKGVLKTFRVDNTEDLCAGVGAGHISGRDVVEAVYPGVKNKKHSDNIIPITRERTRHRKDSDQGKGHAIPIRGLIPGMAIHYAGCCHPLPGDRIVGIVSTGRGVTIHTIDCDTLEQFVEEPERWLDVSWDAHSAENKIHAARVNLIVLNEPGSLGNLSMVIAKNNGNISNLKITNRSTDFFDILIDIEVRDVKHLSEIIAALRATPAINSVERAKG